MNKDKKNMFEIQKELLAIKSSLINIFRNKEAHNEYISFDENILDEIELLQQLIIIESDKFRNDSYFLSQLIRNKEELNMSTYEKNYINYYIKNLFNEINNFIKISNISQDIISSVKKSIIQQNSLRSGYYKYDNNGSLVIQQEFKENIKKLEKQTKDSKEEMKRLQEELEEKEKITAETEQEKRRLEQEKQQLMQEIKEFQEKTKKSEEAKEELNKYKNETEKINRAIDKLRNPATELIISREIFEKKEIIIMSMQLIYLQFL